MIKKKIWTKDWMSSKVSKDVSGSITNSCCECLWSNLWCSTMNLSLTLRCVKVDQYVMLKFTFITDKLDYWLIKLILNTIIGNMIGVGVPWVRKVDCAHQNSCEVALVTRVVHCGINVKPCNFTMWSTSELPWLEYVWARMAGLCPSSLPCFNLHARPTKQDMFKKHWKTKLRNLASPPPPRQR